MYILSQITTLHLPGFPVHVACMDRLQTLQTYSILQDNCTLRHVFLFRCIRLCSFVDSYAMRNRIDPISRARPPSKCGAAARNPPEPNCSTMHVSPTATIARHGIMMRNAPMFCARSRASTANPSEKSRTPALLIHATSEEGTPYILLAACGEKAHVTLIEIRAVPTTAAPAVHSR